MTKATPKKEYVGVPAPQTPKDWEEPAKFLDAMKLQVTKDPDLVFAPVPKPILPYKDLFGKNKVWDKVEEERELGPHLRRVLPRRQRPGPPGPGPEPLEEHKF